MSAVLGSTEPAKQLRETPQQTDNDIGLLTLFKEAYFARNNKGSKVKWKLNYELNKSRKKKAENAEMKYLEEKTFCSLKLSGNLDDHRCRGDLHILFSNHGELKWKD